MRVLLMHGLAKRAAEMAARLRKAKRQRLPEGSEIGALREVGLGACGM